MKILITGGCGFVGANLARYFHAQGHEVTVLDNLARRGSEYNVEDLTKLGLRDPIACEDILSEEQFSLHNRELSFDMEPLTFRIIRLRPAR